MQRRLFILLFPMMFLPAVGVMLLDWQRGREHLDMLEGPGLTRSLDASLALGRRVLGAEKERAEALAGELARDPARSIPAGVQVYHLRREPDGSWRADDQAALDMIGSFDPEGFREARRTGPGGPPGLVAAAPSPQDPAAYTLVYSPLDPELNVLLTEITAGGAGVRQLGLVYSRLLQSHLLLTLVGLTVILLLLSLVLSNLLARSVARPLRELAEGTRKVAAGDLEHRIEREAAAELGELVGSFNTMTAQLAAGRRELRRAERIAAWQGVARRLAHEIKNPLTPINLAMHRIRGKSDDATVQSCVRTVLEEAANLGRLADEFSLYAKLPRPRPQDLDAATLREMLDDVARFYLARTRVTYHWEGWPQDLFWCVDAGQLRQVLSNLIKNGNEAMDGTGRLLFRLEETARPDAAPARAAGGVWWRLGILDTGPGLPDDTEAVFEPYHTSKATGTGLGLAVSRRILEDNGGCLWAENTEEGAAFYLALPAGERIET